MNKLEIIHTALDLNVLRFASRILICCSWAKKYVSGSPMTEVLHRYISETDEVRLG